MPPAVPSLCGAPAQVCQMWSFFLNATRIGENQEATLQQAYESDVVQRFGEMNSVDALQQRSYRTPHIGIHVNGIDNVDVRVFLHQLLKRQAHIFLVGSP